MSKTGENIFMRKDGRWEARYVYRRETGKAKYGYIYSTACKEAKLRRYGAQPKHLNFSDGRNRAEDFGNATQNHLRPVMCHRWFLKLKACGWGCFSMFGILGGSFYDWVICPVAILISATMIEQRVKASHRTPATEPTKKLYISHDELVSRMTIRITSVFLQP